MANYINLYHKNYPFTFECLAYEYPQSPITRPNGYPYYHWLQTDKGIGSITINNTEIILNKGQGIIISPSVPHEYHPYTMNEWYTNYASFSGYLHYVIPKILNIQNYMLISDTPAFSFSSYIRTLISGNHLDEMDDFEQHSISAYSFLMLLQKYSEIDVGITSIQYKTYIIPVLQIIRDRYHENLSIQMLADYVYISPQYLGKLFHRFLNVSPYQYIKQYRLNRAKELLLMQPFINLNEVCYRVGFSDTSRFIHTFKQETGYTPHQYALLSTTDFDCDTH